MPTESPMDPNKPPSGRTLLATTSVLRIVDPTKFPTYPTPVPTALQKLI